MSFNIAPILFTPSYAWSQSSQSNIYSNPFRDAWSCKPADVQRTAIKVSMTAFFDASRQFDFVFRHGRPVLPSLFLRRVDRNFMGRISSLTPMLCPALRMIPLAFVSILYPFVSPPSVLYLSPSFPSFATYRLFVRAIVSHRCRIAWTNRCMIVSRRKWNKIE